LNKIEEIKLEKDGLDVLADVPAYARDGWESITDEDRERLKWLGVFFRRQTPGHFMMRLRIINGVSNSRQIRAIGEIGQEFGQGFVDLTTRQQIQLRWFKIDQVPEIWERLARVGLASLQTGMDNVRNVVNCPVAGLTANELFDASPVVRQYTDMFLGNRDYTNLPRKFNVTITGCRDNCTHGPTQDISLTPAVKEIWGVAVRGFNVAVGGKQGSGGYRPASDLNIFVPPDEAAELCRQITLIFRDFGSRAARNKCRLAFLVDDWGVDRFRMELARRMDRTLLSSGNNGELAARTDHAGIFPQKQPGLNYVGLVVPVGRITSEQLLEIARLAEVYGDGQIRLTPGQNVIIANVPDQRLESLKAEPLLEVLNPNPSEVMRGLVSCTGIDYCHFALIDTKKLAVKTAQRLELTLDSTGPFTIHWSGCPNACGNHTVADIGLLGKRTRVDGRIIDAVDISLGARFAAAIDSGESLENVPCDELPQVLQRLVSAPIALTA
jgi:ferredoxin-nitrite reductase